MKTLLKNIFQNLKQWLLADPELDLEIYQKLESKKYQKRGGFYGE